MSQKELSDLGRELLLEGLRLEYGISDLPEIFFKEFGKPYFKDYPDIHFNISHCGKAVACLLSKEEVGVDVEEIKEFDRELAEFVCSPHEFKKVLESEDPEVAFISLWTRKESYFKFTGKGLDSREEIRNSPGDKSCRFYTCVNKSAGYIVTTCTK